jgi:nucleotide-binding universal stress UspA family protein
MTKKITVGYDGSEPSSQAVMWAAAEATARGAVLRVLSAYAIPYAGEGFAGWAATEAYAALLEDCQNTLADIKKSVGDAYPKLEIVGEASAGLATSALLADVDPDDLIVVGASSHQGAAAFWLGSTPRYLVRHSPCPVVVVRGSATPGRPSRVVVGTDGSPASDRAVQWAGVEAELHQVELLIVHGWEYPYLSVESSSQGRDLTNVDAACLLDSVVESARDQLAVAVTGQLVEGSPPTALLETVRDGDLLALGSSGRGAIAANLFGSTVNAVLDRCPVPAVVVRGQQD